MRLHSNSSAIIAGEDGPDKERAENWAMALHKSYLKNLWRDLFLLENEEC
jgi:hypothetical protein